MQDGQDASGDQFYSVMNQNLTSVSLTVDFGFGVGKESASVILVWLNMIGGVVGVSMFGV